MKDTRPAAFGLMYLGCVLHVIIDIGKNYLGARGISLFAPIYCDLFESGLYFPEDTVYVMPICVLILVCLIFIRRHVFK
jgi:hypothetical protein